MPVHKLLGAQQTACDLFEQSLANNVQHWHSCLIYAVTNSCNYCSGIAQHAQATAQLTTATLVVSLLGMT